MQRSPAATSGHVPVKGLCHQSGLLQRCPLEILGPAKHHCWSNVLPLYIQCPSAQSLRNMEVADAVLPGSLKAIHQQPCRSENCSRVFTHACHCSVSLTKGLKLLKSCMEAANRGAGLGIHAMSIFSVEDAARRLAPRHVSSCMHSAILAHPCENTPAGWP